MDWEWANGPTLDQGTTLLGRGEGWRGLDGANAAHGTRHGPVNIPRVTGPLGRGVESVRFWVRQDGIDGGMTAGVRTDV